MDELTYAALDLMLGSGLTSSPLDNKRAVLALRAAYDPLNKLSINVGDYDVVMDMILRKRANYRRWLTENQRKWQATERHFTKRATRHMIPLCGSRPENAASRLRERIETRERYIRYNAN